MAINAPNPASNPDDASDSVLQLPDNRLLIDLCGELDRNLVQVEARLGVQIHRRGNHLALHGGRARARRGRAGAARALRAAGAGAAGDAGRHRRGDPHAAGAARAGAGAARGARSGSSRCSPPIRWRSAPGASWWSRAPRRRPPMCATSSGTSWCSGIGPAGTGKTYLAVAAAVAMFIEGHVDRIVLSRPAVEAGERLGFLPGDMKEKVDPYMQPLYDALNDFFPAKQVARLIEERADRDRAPGLHARAARWRTPSWCSTRRRTPPPCR